MYECTFTMDLKVFDPETLRQAALKHEDAQPDQNFLDSNGDVDIDACLITLLDPSTLPGCEIHESSNTCSRLDND